MGKRSFLCASTGTPDSSGRSTTDQIGSGNRSTHCVTRHPVHLGHTPTPTLEASRRLFRLDPCGIPLPATHTHTHTHTPRHNLQRPSQAFNSTSVVYEYFGESGLLEAIKYFQRNSWKGGLPDQTAAEKGPRPKQEGCLSAADSVLLDSGEGF